MGLFVCALVIGSAALATAGIPDPTETVATMPNGTNDDLVLFVLPSGIGSGFDEAQIKNVGTVVDATIEMIVKDAFGAIVANFPAEDMWLESGDMGMVPCTGGSTADQDTDGVGFTRWANPLNAGGNSEALCYVYVNGLALNGAPFTLAFNSADMNGDGSVNLVDVGLFSGAFFGAYDFAADFYADGALNLVDVGRLAQGLGGSCP
jgi:hypothetical protein